MWQEDGACPHSSHIFLGRATSPSCPLPREVSRIQEGTSSSEQPVTWEHEHPLLGALLSRVLKVFSYLSLLLSLLPMEARSMENPFGASVI